MVYFVVAIYIIALSFLSFATPLFRNKKWLYVVLLFLPLVFLCSFKSLSVGNDTQAYYDSYHYLADQPLGTVYGEMERGFCILEGIFAKMRLPFSLFLLICYTLFFTSIALFAHRYTRNPAMVALFSLLFQLLNFSISGLRQSVAMGLCLLGLYLFLWFFGKGKSNCRWLGLALFLVMITVSVFLHRSSIVFYLTLPFYFLRNKVRPNAFLFALITLAIAFMSPYLYGLIFNVIRPFLFYDPPKGRFFLDLGASTYILILVPVAMALIAIPVVDRFGGKVEARLSLPKGIEFWTRTRHQVATEQWKPVDETIDNFFYLCHLATILMYALFLTSSSMSRSAFFLLPLCFIYMAKALESIRFTRIRALTYAAATAALFVYFYFATIRSGYLHINPYQVGFYL